GIDTPETHFNDKSQGEWAFRAAARLKQLLPKGAEVQVELDRFACDSRGRTLAYVHKNGVNLNRLMIEEGWAVNYCVAPNFKHCEEYGAVVEKNIVQKRGFLADPGVQLPYLFREQGRENDFEYYIGDMHTKLVISSAKMDDIPVAQRVFFYSARRIRPPYRLAVP
ncbi:MAG: thermonuclease family protein, partial [Bdellovibrionales bacterium]